MATVRWCSRLGHSPVNTGSTTLHSPTTSRLHRSTTLRPTSRPHSSLIPSATPAFPRICIASIIPHPCTSKLPSRRFHSSFSSTCELQGPSSSSFYGDRGRIFSRDVVQLPQPGRWRQGSQRFSTTISMGLQTGIVGLPNVGKSTLFNALVENGKAQAANFPFCTIEPNVGIVAVPDPRLEILHKISKSQRTVPTSVEFVDIAGLVKGASEGEGLGNKFLSHIRQVDSIVQVVRCFEDDDIVHVSGEVNPVADIDVINLELILADLFQIEKRVERLNKSKAKDPQLRAKEEMELEALERVSKALNAGAAARTVDLSDEEEKAVGQLSLLTMKPVVYAANVAESDLADPSGNRHVAAVREFAAGNGAECIVVSAQVEAELTELGPEDRRDYLESLGVSEGGLGGLIRATYTLLGLRTYFTTGEQESRAWAIRAGMTAPQAAGVIHSDFERGFIRAETVAYKDFVDCGSLAIAREKGLLRSEGKEYIVQEGDVMLFRFNV